MEDLAARGWTFPDPMDDSVSERDAADMIDQMATYHAAFWRGHGNGDALDRLPSALEFQQRLNARAGFARRFRRGLERSREVIPAALWRRRDEIWPAVMRSLELNVRGPQTLLHQDVHQSNWLRDPEGRIGLYY